MNCMILIYTFCITIIKTYYNLQVCLVEGAVTTETSVEMEEETPVNPGRAPEQVSELGAIILTDPVAGPAVLHTVSVK